MKVLITGASGLLGGALARDYVKRGYEVSCWVHKTRLGSDLERHVQAVTTANSLNGHFDLVINLAGASVAGGLWTTRRKAIIRQSRVDFTRQLLAPAIKGQYSIGHLISGSAIGYYGPTSDPVSENAPFGLDFGASFVADWEVAAQEAAAQVNKITLVRTGLVLSKQGGLLKPLSRPARFGMATRLGDGQQGQSWIHHTDWCNAIDWILEHELVGPVNLTAPNPVSQNDFNQCMSTVLKRPYFMRMPAKPLRLAMGELASLVLEGQWVLPSRLQESGFTFQYPSLEPALRDLLL